MWFKAVLLRNEVGFAFFSLHSFLESKRGIDCLFSSNFFYMFSSFSLLLSLFSVFLCLPFSSFFHSLALLCYLAFRFPLQLHYFTVMLCSALSCLLFSEPISCISGSPDNEAEVHKTLSATFFTQTLTHRCQPGDRLSFPSFIFFLTLL